MPSREKSRLLVLTDIGSDPDDEQSLVRLLVTSNEFDIEGIIPNMWVGHKGRHGPLSEVTQMDLVHKQLDLYGEVAENLSCHAEDFPSAEYLHSVLKRGQVEIDFALDSNDPGDVSGLVGPGKDTEGSEWIATVVDRDDPRPVDVSIWGGQSDLAQALWKVRETRTPEALKKFVSKIRVYSIGNQDKSAYWIRNQFPEQFYILNHSRTGDKWGACYRGMCIGGDESLTSREWIDEHVRHDHGPLGTFYSPKTYTHTNPHMALKECDTPSWFYFYNNGLHVPSEPGYGGWGGRFGANGHYYQDVPDTVGSITGNPVTVWRWRAAFQREFQARMDWCVAGKREANHPPQAVLNDDRTRQPIDIEAKPGSVVKLDATGSSDPDGDGLGFQWWIYREAGTFDGSVNLEDADTSQTVLHVPEEAEGRSVHVILEVTDDGTPPLTAYRRAIIRCCQERITG